MQTTPVSYFSEGQRISAVWRTPDHQGPYRAIVQGPGWLGLKDAKLYVRYHEALVDAGFAVLVIDYRGFGDSEGDRGYLSPAWQLQDLVNAVTYLTTRDDFGPMNEAYGEFVGARVASGVLPARTTVFTGLPREEMLVEIDALAVLA